jgi:hypothetical protein
VAVNAIFSVVTDDRVLPAVTHLLAARPWGSGLGSTSRLGRVALPGPWRGPHLAMHALNASV